ncbi:MAG TPA: diguanylate cyclase, partial [Candidatus Baltobacteraceae bacterium]|nr:diguanylate cyclase [Candidatus Baltobacteraceae bacterium]
MGARGGAAPSRLVLLGGGVLAVAGLAAALTINASQFTLADWLVTICGSTAIAFVATQALPIRGLRMRRTGLNAEAVVLDLSIAAPIFALGGAVGVTASATALAAGYGAASLLRRAGAPTDLARHGVMRTLAVLAFLPFAPALGIRNLPIPIGSAVFAGIVTVVGVAFVLLISAPLSAYTYHISVARVWGRVLCDPRTWITGVGNIIWATVVRDPMIRDHYYVAIAMWLPVAVAALLLRTIDEQHAELHRLRLVRDAVQAMLGDRDPLPQINAILATLRVPAFDETVSILAATGARTDTWRTVTTLGPALSSAGDELRRRILARLKFSGRAYTTLRDDYYVAYAFAALLADGEVHGAMIVHRRNDRPLSNEQVSQFTNAAFELAPLLRDMRSIAAAQSAATTDGLTGLFNRTATMERLQVMLDELTIPNHAAILLLDIDHFKLIND